MLQCKRWFGSTRVQLAMAFLVGGAVLAPVTVFASHQFSDVPDTHPFHDEISAIAGAGVTTGFSDGTFRPGNTVTRQAMAAFVERSGARVAHSSGSAFVRGGELESITAVTIASGAAVSGNGFVALEAIGYAYVYGAHATPCPCALELRIVDQYGNFLTAGFTTIPSQVTSTGYSVVPISLSTVVDAPADTTRTYRLLAYGYESDATGMSVDAALSATYVPFSGDGDHTQQFSLGCPEDDGYEQNDSSTQRAVLYLGHSNSAISCPGDEDWFRLNRTILAGETLTVNALFAHAAGNIDVCIVTASGDQSTCGTSTTSNETVTLVAPANSSYSVRVYLASESDAVVGNTYHLYATASGGGASAIPDAQPPPPPPSPDDPADQ